VVLEIYTPLLFKQFCLDYFMLLHHLEIQHGKIEGNVSRF